MCDNSKDKIIRYSIGLLTKFEDMRYMLYVDSQHVLCQSIAKEKRNASNLSILASDFNISWQWLSRFTSLKMLLHRKG